MVSCYPHLTADWCVCAQLSLCLPSLYDPACANSVEVDIISCPANWFLVQELYKSIVATSGVRRPMDCQGTVLAARNDTELAETQTWCMMWTALNWAGTPETSAMSEASIK